MTDDKKCIRFRPAYDILLLREVVAKQPEDKVSWDAVVQNVNVAIAEQQPGQAVTFAKTANFDGTARMRWHLSERSLLL